MPFERTCLAIPDLAADVRAGAFRALIIDTKWVRGMRTCEEAGRDRRRCNRVEGCALL